MPPWLFACCLLLMAILGYLFGLAAPSAGPTSGKPAKSHDRGSITATDRGTITTDAAALLAQARQLEWNGGAALPLWQTVRAMDLQQVHAALALLADDRKDEGRAELRKMLFLRWGELDPHGALASLPAVGTKEATEAKEELRNQVLISWLKNDPERALPVAGPLGEKRKGHLSFVGEQAVARTLATVFTDTALTRAKAFSPDLLHQTAYWLAANRNHDPAAREAMIRELAACGDTEIRSAGNLALFAGWTDGEPDAAMARLAALELPDRDRTALREQALDSCFGKHWGSEFPAHLFDWMARSEGLAGSEFQTDSIVEHLSVVPEATLQWLSRQGAGSADYRRFADQLQHHHDSSTKLVPLLSQWRKIDPAAADAWQPASAREGGANHEPER